jgi:hypothetical protein
MKQLQPKLKLIVEEQLAKKIAGIATNEMRTISQQLAYWASIYEAKNGAVTPRAVEQEEEKKERKPMVISPERRAQMREQGLKLAIAAKAKADARRARANGLAH